MAVICPKCSHVRLPDAGNPDWQCPNCGICYAKFTGHPVAPRPAAPAATAGQGLRLGWLFKVLLLIVLVLILKTLIERRQAARPQAADVLVVQQEERQAGSDAGVALANAAIAASGTDASLLHSLSGRLERACVRNKYGLSESACIARFRAREDLCADSTARRFPGQIGNTDRMQVLVKAYLGCIFEQG